MARTRSSIWTIIICLLLGIVAATIFWLYTPYGHNQLAQQVVQDLKSQPLQPGAKGGPLNLKKMFSQAMGSRFQMVTDGKDVFVVDLKDGRVWRYFHENKASGGPADEGFLPMPFYFAGHKHYSATEIGPPAATQGNPATPAPQEKKPQ
jgi:hypothetical protein